MGSRQCPSRQQRLLSGLTMPSRTAVLMACLFGACVKAAVAVVWVKGSGGVNCDTVCASRDGCNEEAEWPKSEKEFLKVAKQAGHVCEGTQEGGAKYDPST